MPNPSPRETVNAATVDVRGPEVRELQEVLRAARSGQGGARVLRGVAGVGKTTLLTRLVRGGHDHRLVSVRGIRFEADLSYAGLRRLCSDLEDRCEDLAPHLRAALRTATAPAGAAEPDPFLVSVATLTLLHAAGAAQPVLCLVDDAQLLDQASARVLVFVARRLQNARVAMVFAERTPAGSSVFEGLPVTVVRGFGRAEARVLLDPVLRGRVDEDVVDRIVAEARGNPRTILELVRGLDTTDVAGGFGVDRTPVTPQAACGASRDRVSRLGPASRTLLLIAAADPTGNLALLWRAAAALGITASTKDRLRTEGLLTFGTLVTFDHPPLRSWVYQSAPVRERRTVHAALATATDPAAAPDRRAWHHAQAACGPDESLADSLVAQVGEARDRGGPAAAAAFLRTAAELTHDARRQAERFLDAATAAYEAGSPDSAWELLAKAEDGALDAAHRAEAHRLRAWLSFVRAPCAHTPDLLLRAAHRLAPVAPGAARQTSLDALAVAILAGPRGESRRVAERAREVLPHRGPQPGTAVDSLLDALTVHCTDGYAAAVDPLKAALVALRTADEDIEVVRSPWLVSLVAVDLWDDDAWHAVTGDALRSAQQAGSVPALSWALPVRAMLEVHSGSIATAIALTDRATAIAGGVRHPALEHAALLIAGWQGHEVQALAMIENAHAQGDGHVRTVADLATAVLYNGLGRHPEALAAARRAAARDEPALLGWALAELVESAVDAGRPDAATAALEQLTERTDRCGTDWALGIGARSRALLSSGPAAEALHVEAVRRLGRTRLRTQLARAHLVHGEWLRLQGRRADARVALRTARDLFVHIGAEAFAARARRALLAGGDAVENLSTGTDTLTAQEDRIAQLARNGLSNPEIGGKLLISPRTVEYHLRKVFAKLHVRSRTELPLAMTDETG